jgi:hypothetical protein
LQDDDGSHSFRVFFELRGLKVDLVHLKNKDGKPFVRSKKVRYPVHAPAHAPAPAHATLANGDV